MLVALDAVASFEEFISDLAAVLGSVNPVLASFAIAFVSNVIPYMTVPYLVVIAGFGAMKSSMFEKFLIGIGGGLGAAVAKMVVFYIGGLVHHALSEETKENLDIFVRAFRRSMFVAIFLFAALPLPDDVLYIPLGVAGYSPVLFFIAVSLGKIVLTLAAVYFGYFVGGNLGPLAIVALVAASLVIAYIVLKMNWRRVVEVYTDYGLIAAFIEMVGQGFAVILPGRLGDRVIEQTERLISRLSRSERREEAREAS